MLKVPTLFRVQSNAEIACDQSCPLLESIPVGSPSSTVEQCECNLVTFHSVYNSLCAISIKEVLERFLLLFGKYLSIC